MLTVGSIVLSPLGKAQVRREYDRYTTYVRILRTGQTVLLPTHQIIPYPEVEHANRPAIETLGQGTT